MSYMYEKAVVVAKNHYYFLERGGYEKWLETLMKDLQRSASIGGFAIFLMEYW